MNKTEEIRFLLMGRLTVREDGCVVENVRGWRNGLPDGWWMLRLFGVSRRMQRYTAEGSDEELQQAGIKALQDMGRLLVMSEAPMVPAALYRSWSTEYALLTAEVEEHRLLLTAFYPRSPVAGLKCRRLIRKCASCLPEDFEAVYTKQEKDEKKKSKDGKKKRRLNPFRRKTPEEKQAALEEKRRAAEEKAAKRSAKRAEQAQKAAQRAEAQAQKAIERAEEARRSAAAAADRGAQEDENSENKD